MDASVDPALARHVKREANLRFRATLLDEDPDPAAFFCECGDADCLAAVWLSATDYDSGRAQPGWAPLARGHLA